MHPSFYPKHLARQAAAGPGDGPGIAPATQQQVTQPPPVNRSQQQQQSVSSRGPHSTVFEGLPGPFIEAMKKLFDLVDVRKEGRVRIEDIAG